MLHLQKENITKQNNNNKNNMKRKKDKKYRIWKYWWKTNIKFIIYVIVCVSWQIYKK